MQICNLNLKRLKILAVQNSIKYENDVSEKEVKIYEDKGNLISTIPNELQDRLSIYNLIEYGCNLSTINKIYNLGVSFLHSNRMYQFLKTNDQNLDLMNLMACSKVHNILTFML